MPIYHLNLFLLSRHQRDLMLQHAAKNEQRGFGVGTVSSLHDNIRSLEQGAGRRHPASVSVLVDPQNFVRSPSHA